MAVSVWRDCYACWIKGVRFIGANASGCCGLFLGSIGNFLFANNSSFSSPPYYSSGEARQSSSFTAHSTMLFQNNVIEGRRDQFNGGAGSSIPATSTPTTSSIST